MSFDFIRIYLDCKKKENWLKQERSKAHLGRRSLEAKDPLRPKVPRGQRPIEAKGPLEAKGPSRPKAHRGQRPLEAKRPSRKRPPRGQGPLVAKAPDASARLMKQLVLLFLHFEKVLPKCKIWAAIGRPHREDPGSESRVPQEDSRL